MSVRKSLLVLLCLFLGETSTFKWHTLDNLEYYFANKATSDYNAALLACKEMGANLAKFNSLRIHQILTKFTVPHKGFYIGLKRVQNTKEFRWLDGTNLTWTNWKYESPHCSDGRRSRDCVIVKRRSRRVLRWIDFPCNVRLGYICQRFVATTSYPYVLPPQDHHLLQQQPSVTATVLSTTKNTRTEMPSSQAQQSNDPITIVISTMIGEILLLFILVFLVCKRPPQQTYGGDTVNELARGRALYPSRVFMKTKDNLKESHVRDENGYVRPNPVFPSKRTKIIEDNRTNITNRRSSKGPELAHEIASHGTLNSNQFYVNTKVPDEEYDEDKHGYVSANRVFPVSTYVVTNET